ncbi:Bardet-Biedl syndrome 4 protein [Borealophlyctis nickersoniae]|nr:Bardet-Biedl syndrome 4 protein [Borealophlyctis nickersoniae]
MDHKALIEKLIQSGGYGLEYCLYVKAQILLTQPTPNIPTSLSLFQKSVTMNPGRAQSLMGVAKCLMVMGRHKAAVEVYRQMAKVVGSDWKLHHQLGTCYAVMKEYDKAVSNFHTALSIHAHDVTYAALGRLHVANGNDEDALGVYEQAVE